jgi:hypothetical protein
MKVKIDRDELWPVYSVYSISENYGYEVEIPDDIVEAWRMLEKKHEEMNGILGTYYHAAKNKT